MFLLLIKTEGDLALLMGVVAVPPCFSPTDEFLGYLEELDLGAALVDEDGFLTAFGGPVRDQDLERGAALLDAVTAIRTADVYARSTLN